ncbi:amidase domain-containing protein [Paludifilum halophilum]|nr:amidase domain-containing protein [Paludifilum halophilum]
MLQMRTVLAMILSAILVVAGCSSSSEEAKGEQPATPEEEGHSEKSDALSDDELVESVSYYDESERTQKDIKSQNKAAMEIVQQKNKDQNIDVKPDLDDKQFRDHIKGMATNMDSLSKEEQKLLARLAKLVDDYENHLKNEEIKKLVKKLKEGKLTPAEKAKLRDLLPVNDSGPKLKPGQAVDPKEGSGTGIDKKKPGAGKPEEGTDQESPEKEQPEKEEPKDKPNSEDEQPNPEDENQNPDDNQQEPGDENQNDEEEQQNPEDENQNPDDNQQEPGDENQNNEEEQQNPDDENQNPDDNQQEPGDENQNDEEEQQNPDDENQNDEEEQQNPDDENQNGDDNQQDPDENQDEEQSPEEDRSMVEKNGYDREKARDYAYKWWNKRNNEEYGYYSRAMGGCYDCWYDCTNFVSQAISKGGLVQWKSDPWWYYSDEKPSYAWGVANSLYKHMDQRAEPAKSVSELKVGDVVNGDLNGDGDIDHTAIITKIENGQIYVTQHTTDRKDAPLNAWFAAGYDVYGWKMGTADNQPR